MTLYKYECPECLGTPMAEVVDGKSKCPCCGAELDCSEIYLIPVVPGQEPSGEPAGTKDEVAESISAARFVLFDDGVEAAVDLFNGLFEEYGDNERVFDGVIWAIRDWVAYLVASEEEGLYESRLRYLVDQLEVGVSSTFAADMVADALDLMIEEASKEVSKERAEEIISNLYEMLRDVLLCDGNPEEIAEFMDGVTDVLTCLGQDLIGECENWYVIAFILKLDTEITNRMENLDTKRLGPNGEIDLEIVEEAILSMEKVLNAEEQKPGEDHSKLLAKYFDKVFPQKGSARNGRRAAVKKGRY